MIGLIPFIQDDYILTLIYIFIILLSITIKCEHNDFKVLVLGFLIMTVAEFLFVSTGVEIFLRISFLNTMPLWLPFLWAYGFVVIKRSSFILNK